METAAPQLIHLEKLHEDGRYKEFRGNTIVSFVTRENNPLWYSALIESQKIVEDSGLAYLHSMLPPESFHVTIFDLITEPRPSNRTKDLIGAPLSQVEAAMITRLKPLLIKEKENPSQFTFKFNGLYLTQGWSTFCLELTCVTKSEVDAFRKDVSRLTGAPYDEKVFHITIAYNRYKDLPQELMQERNQVYKRLEVLWKEVLEKEPILIPTKPYLTFFRDMTDFPTDRYSLRTNHCSISNLNLEITIGWSLVMNQEYHNHWIWHPKTLIQNQPCPLLLSANCLDSDIDTNK